MEGLLKGQASRGKRINDILGIDLGQSSVKLVRLKRSGTGVTLLDADVMPALDLNQGGGKLKLDIQKKIQAPYAAMCYSGNKATVRFLDLPTKVTPGRVMEGRLRKLMGLGNDYRLSYTVARPGSADKDQKVLAVAVPVKPVLYANSDPIGSCWRIRLKRCWSRSPQVTAPSLSRNKSVAGRFSSDFNHPGVVASDNACSKSVAPSNAKV